MNNLFPCKPLQLHSSEHRLLGTPTLLLQLHQEQQQQQQQEQQQKQQQQQQQQRQQHLVHNPMQGCSAAAPCVRLPISAPGRMAGVLAWVVQQQGPQQQQLQPVGPAPCAPGAAQHMFFLSSRPQVGNSLPARPSSYFLVLVVVQLAAASGSAPCAPSHLPNLLDPVPHINSGAQTPFRAAARLQPAKWSSWLCA